MDRPDDQGEGKRMASEGRRDEASAERSPAGPSRMRFSVEAARSQEEGADNGAPKRVWQAVPSLEPTSVGRNRGYSLRRALFAQKIQKQAPSVEGESQAHVQQDVDEATRESWRSTTVPVKEAGMTLDSGEKKALWSSAPVLGLPLYRRLLPHQSSRSTLANRVQSSYRRLRDRISLANTIPPSVDGRHVCIKTSDVDRDVDERTGKLHINNLVRSSRYTPWNFVPRQLVAQFSKIANCYFLCVSILQMIPGLSTTGTYTTIVPLLVFVALSMAKEGYDDVRRARLDREENNRIAYILRIDQSGQTGFHWHERKWSDLQVGDVVLLTRDDGVPADLVLLDCDESTETAYVETKSLDGETNLKSKQALPDVSASCKDMESVARLQADFVVEDPNPDLYKFDGRVSIGGKILPLTNTEILYRGSILRNTSSATGLVIYSGEECKIRMNANKTPRTKAPTLQAKVNKVVIFVAALVVFMAFILTGSYQIWRQTTEEKAWYLHDAKVPFGHVLTSFVIMLNTMLPLSLYVSLEIVKLAQMFLMNDVDMYDTDSDTPMEAHTSTINEELGQVGYIFSDKTGTLTSNSMKFRRLSIAGTAWLHDWDLQVDAEGDGDRERPRHKKRDGKEKHRQSESKHRKSSEQSPRTSTASALTGLGYTNQHGNVLEKVGRDPGNGFDQALEGKTQEMLEYIWRRPHTHFAQRARFFLLSLALCHTCIPEKDDDGAISYQAASPDESALVSAAQDLGYVVTDRNSSSVTVRFHRNGEENSPIYETYEVLDVVEFSSARKRMSIIVRFPDKRLCLISKGADSTIRQLLRLADLAASRVESVARRASERKSFEIQEALKRRSTQASRRSGSPHVLYSTSPRASGFSFDRSQDARASVDEWQKERERESSTSRPCRSAQFYSPKPSMLLEFQQSGNTQVRLPHSPHRSSQHDPADELVDESLVIDDKVVFERCFQHVDDFATDGLRTLLYAYRYLTENEYSEWKQVYSSATTSIVDRQEKIERAAELLETNLELLGATAIEDKLQQGVPDAIDRFRRAGIKMWMLTGDKRETAINIGHSCRLIKDFSTVIVLNHEQGDLNSRMAEACAKIHDDSTAHSVVVVDGQTLTIIDNDRASRALFTDIAIKADSVICCRASPSQKASLVRTIRTKVRGSVTLAIGDGANDIAMIQEAHVGIGIAGKEGLQAARTSDYSIAQFRFLLKLLLVHGRWNYIRICKYLLGTLWKEMMFYLIQAIYQRWNGYTGTSLYEPWSLSMFNTLFTSLPVIFMGVFEKDLAASTLLAVPELYSLGQRDRGFNFWLYIRWSVLAACEGVLIYFMVYGIYGLASFTKDQELYAFGNLMFTAAVVFISLKLQFIELHNKSIAGAIAIFLSVGGWFLWNLLLSLLYAYNPIYSVRHAFLERFGRNFLWWITLLLTVAAVCLLEVIVKVISATMWPTDVDIFQNLEQDREIRQRFEEAASDYLQAGWHRESKRSSLKLTRNAAEEAEREAQVEEILMKRDMDHDEQPELQGKSSTFGAKLSGLTRRQHYENAEKTASVVTEHEMSQVPHVPQVRRSIDIGELFSKGYGAVRRSKEF